MRGLPNSSPRDRPNSSAAAGAGVAAAPIAPATAAADRNRVNQALRIVVTPSVIRHVRERAGRPAYSLLMMRFLVANLFI